MSRFLDALRSGKVILMDGAMGTELMRKGLRAGESAEEWNLHLPEQVKAIHEAYLDAGATCLLTNTFEAKSKPIVVRDVGEPPWQRMNEAGVRLARSAGAGKHFVLASVGPPLGLLHGTEPFSFTDVVAASTRCLQQMELLIEADAMLLETQSSLRLLEEILERASYTCRLIPWIVSFAFAKVTGEPVCYPDLETPEAIAEAVATHRGRFVALGVNCGRDIGMNEIIDIVRRYRKVTDLPILARPNAGTPKRVGNEWVYPETPARMAARLPELIDAGATLIGGCCGTTPAHIAAFREVIDRLGVRWKP